MNLGGGLSPSKKDHSNTDCPMMRKYVRKYDMSDNVSYCRLYCTLLKSRIRIANFLAVAVQSWKKKISDSQRFDNCCVDRKSCRLTEGAKSRFSRDFVLSFFSLFYGVTKKRLSIRKRYGNLGVHLNCINVVYRYAYTQTNETYD